MGILGNALKIGALTKVVQVVRREANKPENRQKAMDAYNKVKNRRTGGQGRAGM